MADKFSTTSQVELTRRDMMKAAAATGAAALVPALGSRTAAAAGEPVVRGYGVTTAQLKDWSNMTKSIGVQMDFSGTNNSVGVFLRDVVASQLGDKVDIFIFESGTEDILGPQGVYLEIDEKNPELKLWGRTADEWKRSEVVQGKDGKQYGVPVIGNADSFGYFPDKIGVDPSGQEDISWQVMFENEKTRGRVAYDQTWTYSIGSAALYLQGQGKAKFANIADMTRDEAKTVVDFLIARKKAGQFRTLHSAFEEQVQLLTNREVDVINCWEPATRDANMKLGANTVRYAYTVEGYFKWGHGAYIAAQAKDRGNLDTIYKVLNYFLDGEYRALQARDRGYAGPNMDLGVAYAEKNGWSAEDIANLKATDEKVTRKFKKPFVSTTTPSNSDAIEEEWQRFLNA
ncbi:twin-arginine translocation signal domain-containing protein [Chelatococcus sp. GCM10030263]|uniref:twin-arginine translocation signal domain-containing protein n=1 Tax=Chelatococcus sp. GCM10030263 TaxID=3273387 RepID=UPI0036168D6F